METNEKFEVGFKVVANSPSSTAEFADSFVRRFLQNFVYRFVALACVDQDQVFFLVLDFV